MIDWGNYYCSCKEPWRIRIGVTDLGCEKCFKPIRECQYKGCSKKADIGCYCWEHNPYAGMYDENEDKRLKEHYLKTESGNYKDGKCIVNNLTKTCLNCGSYVLEKCSFKKCPGWQPKMAVKTCLNCKLDGKCCDACSSWQPKGE